MGIRDIELYNKKNLTKVNVDYHKEYHTFLAKIQAHQDKLYQLLLINPETKKEQYTVNNIEPVRFNLRDEDVDRVDILPDSDDIYKFYLVSDSAHDRNFWKDRFGFSFPDNCLVSQKLDYDLQYLSDEMFSYLEIILKQYEKDTRSDRVYVPLAHIASMEIFGKLFGEGAAAFLGMNPFMNVFVILWLHGYLMSSAVKKQGVKLRLNEVAVSLQEIEIKQKEMEEALDRIIKHFKDDSDGGWKTKDEEEGESNDGTT